MANPKNKKELKQQYDLHTRIGQFSELPIARIIAKVINAMSEEVGKYNEDIDEVVEKWCEMDDKGNRLGIIANDYGDGIEKVRKNVSGAVYNLDDLAIKEDKREDFNAEIKKLQDMPADFKYSPVDINEKMVRIIVPRAFKKGDVEEVCNVEITVPMIEVLEKKLPVQTLAFVLDTIVKYDKEE